MSLLVSSEITLAGAVRSRMATRHRQILCATGRRSRPCRAHPPRKESLRYRSGVVDLVERVRRDVEEDLAPGPLAELVGEHREVVE